MIDSSNVAPQQLKTDKDVIKHLTERLELVISKYKTMCVKCRKYEELSKSLITDNERLERIEKQHERLERQLEGRYESCEDQLQSLEINY